MKGSCSVLGMSGLALSFYLCLLLFVHPRPYPHVVLSIAGVWKGLWVKCPFTPHLFGPWSLLSQGQELTDNDSFTLNNYSSSWIWLGI